MTNPGRPKAEREQTRCGPRRPATRGAFTLIEILVVIGIIVLLIALAVPALSVISGSNSINGAENNLSAMLGRVRAEAIAMQRDTGIVFFIDPASQGVAMAQVHAAAGNPGVVQVLLDLVPDRDFMALPKGVSLQVIDNAELSGGSTGNRTDDGYIGYNVQAEGSAPPDATTRVGGVILFDASGKLVSRSYAFAAQNNGVASAIFNLLYTGKATADPANPITETANFVPNALVPMTSGYGVVLFDREGIENNGDLDDPQATGVAYDAAERGEETWIDENGTPLMVNRYNGTLVRGE